jgi:uncharacterized damage-inducible protein DinB
MQLVQAGRAILKQLSDAIRQMTEEDFIRPLLSLSQATVGQHVRHTLEFFICLEHGFEHGVVNYDKRAHDKLIETDRCIALAAIDRVSDFISSQTEDRKLALEVGYEPHDDRFLTIETNYLRELTYNIEHAVHHMAIMKIGIREVAPYVQLSSDFGVAASTVRYMYKESGIAARQ